MRAVASDQAPDSEHSVHRTSFVSPGRFVWDRVVAPMTARGEALVVSRPLDLPRRARVTRTHRPLRQLSFVDGDRISGELLQGESDSLHIRLAGGHVASVSRSSIESIAVPPGEVEMIAQPSLTVSPQDASATVAIPHEPSRGARVQFWFRVERVISSDNSGRMSFHFGALDAANNATERLSLQLDGTRLAVVERPHGSARWTTQSAELTPGWHCLTTVSSSAQFLCLVDDSLLASSSHFEAPLRSIHFTPRPGFEINDLLVSSLRGSLDTQRDGRLLCVVETPADQAALERTGAFRGYYFVLMGKLSPLDGIGPKDIALHELFDRAQDGTVSEVILATNFTAEGEATAHVIGEALRARGLTVTRLARGVPAGSELEYVDLGTIAHALVDRR